MNDITAHHARVKVQILKEEEATLRKEREKLERMLAQHDSEEFIAKHRITKANVQKSKGKGIPWFPSPLQYIKWLDGNSAQPWAELNGRIYRTADLIAGRMPESVALYETLKD